MTDKILIDRAVAQKALDALDWNLPFIEDYGDKEQLSRQHKAIASLYDALRQTIEQAEKHEQLLRVVNGVIQSSSILEGYTGNFYIHPSAAPEQEPVAWRTFDGEGGYDYRTYDDNENYRDEWERRNPSHKGWVEPLYLHPSRRECDDLYSLLERAEVEMRYAGWGRRQEDNFGRFEVYSQVIKALKEKNT